jgi:hypothetical protein
MSFGNSRLRIAPGVVAVNDGDVMILVRLEDSYGSEPLRYHTLNAVGKRLWKRLCDGASFADLVAWHANADGLAPADAETDVRDFLVELQAAGLILSTDG